MYQSLAINSETFDRVRRRPGARKTYADGGTVTHRKRTLPCAAYGKVKSSPSRRNGRATIIDRTATTRVMGFPVPGIWGRTWSSVCVRPSEHFSFFSKHLVRMCAQTMQNGPFHLFLFFYEVTAFLRTGRVS